MRIALLVVLALVLSAGVLYADPAAGWGQDNTNWSQATGSYDASNFVYDWSIYEWLQGVDNPVGGGGFTVKADIEMWMNMHFDATDIYFHIGRDPGDNPTLQRDVAGWLTSNNGQWLFVSKPDFQPDEAEITELVFMNDIGHRQGQTADPIPVNWLLNDGSGFAAGTYSTGGNNGNLYGVTWLLNGGSRGLHNFTIRCEISPDRYQPDGYYEMDPVLVCSPEV